MPPGDPIIQIEDDGQNAVFRLPNHDLGELRPLAWGGILTSIIGVLFMAIWMSMPIHHGIEMLTQGESMGWALIGFGCLGILGLIPMLGIGLAADAFLNGNTWTELHLSGPRLTERYCFGWIRWGRKVPISQLQTLRLEYRTLESRSPGRRRHGWVQELAGLTLLDSRGQRISSIGEAYRFSTLEQLSEQLLPKLIRNLRPAYPIELEKTEKQSSRPLHHDSPTTEQNDGPLAESSVEWAIPAQPASSTIQLVRQAGQPTVLQIPAPGFRGVPRGLIVTGILWLIGLTILAGFVGWGPGNQGPIWQPLALIAALAVPGLALLWMGWKLSQCSAMVGVSDSELFWEIQKLFGKTWQHFPAQQILRISVVDSTTEINDRPVKVLEVVDKDGKARTAFMFRDEAELEWIAAILRNELALPAYESDHLVDWRNLARVDSVFTLPANSPLQLDSEIDQVCLTVPALGMVKMIPTMIAALIQLGIAGTIVYFQFPFAREPMLGLISGIVTLTGFATGYGALSYYLRRYEIAIQHQTLIIRRFTMFWAPLQKSWQAPQLVSIEVADSGIKSNNKTLYVLRIESNTEPPFKFLWGRPEKQLAYAAAFIHHHLSGIPGENDPR